MQGRFLTVRANGSAGPGPSNPAGAQGWPPSGLASPAGMLGPDGCQHGAGSRAKSRAAQGRGPPDPSSHCSRVPWAWTPRAPCVQPAWGPARILPGQDAPRRDRSGHTPFPEPSGSRCSKRVVGPILRAGSHRGAEAPGTLVLRWKPQGLCHPEEWPVPEQGPEQPTDWKPWPSRSDRRQTCRGHAPPPAQGTPWAPSLQLLRRAGRRPAVRGPRAAGDLHLVMTTSVCTHQASQAHLLLTRQPCR